jgi:hypothetical protein
MVRRESELLQAGPQFPAIPFADCAARDSNGVNFRSPFGPARGVSK